MKDYRERISEESEFWSKETRESLIHGLPMSVDYRHGAKLDRENAHYWDDPQLDNFVRGVYRRQIIRDALRAGTKALDLCCGNGWLALELARSGANVLGIDISEERIRVASKHAALDSLITGSVKFVVKDLNYADFGEVYYDVVTAWDGLHHIPESDRLLGEIYRVLKPGGRLIFFESLNRSCANQDIAKILWFILPGRKSYFYKMNLLLKKVFFGGKKQEIPSSPFEDVAGVELVEYVEKRFSVLHKEESLAILPIIAASFDCRSRLQRSSLILLRMIDSILVRLGVLRGQYIYLIAVKK